MLAEATALLDLGWHLFPIAKGGKVPAIPRDKGGRGLLDATLDPDAVQAWLTEYPNANSGVACGPSGLVVVDIDPRHGGFESLDELVKVHGDGWQRTPTGDTPGGGCHYYLKAPRGVTVPSTGSSKPLLPGIDVKADGGYVVCPPSRRPDGVYRWRDGLSPFDVPLAIAPAWLLERLYELKANRPGSSVVSVAPADSVAEGTRNNHLASIAGALRQRGLDLPVIEAALLEENTTKCIPPLPEREVHEIAASIARYEPGAWAREASVGRLFSHSSLFSPATQPEWPDPPGTAAFHGLAGEVIETCMPHTEADPVAVLANLLVAFGNIVGTGPHVRVGAGIHGPREFFVLVGSSSKARKGDSWAPIATLFDQVDPGWHTASGLSSGEGLIYHVRDQSTKQEPIKEKGRVVDYQTVIGDEGVDDKRLLVFEPEFARVLRMTERSGNSLSATIRQAWDTGRLQTLTKNSPLQATGAHISIVGHITIEELLHELPDVEAANGFANRFGWFTVRRSKLLPDPEPFAGPIVSRLASSLSRAVEAASVIGELRRDATANDLWHEIYGDLSGDRPGLAGALLARAEAHVLRLSMIYALLDGCPEILREHLVAAVELWAYAERSVEFIFGDSLGNPVADTILKALRVSGPLTRTAISELFGRHESSSKIANALQSLLTSGKAQMATEASGGRPSEVWRAVA